MKVKIENKRKHEAFIAEGVGTIPALGSIEIDHGKWMEIYASDKYKRAAVNKGYLVVEQVVQKQKSSKKKQESAE